MDYPFFDIGIGGALLMAIVAISHVIVSHFAVGGGLLIAVTETLAVRRGDWELRELARRSSLVLILVSTVFGAISGVGIWVVAGLIAPAAISALIHTYVWGWAIEWVFFILEIVAALVYYATWDRISKGAHLLVGWLYFVGAYCSLVIINGIITFQLTPGAWLADHAFWSGFFNPTYLPATVLRTGIVALMAVAFMLFPALKAGEAARPRLVRYLGWWLAGGALLAYVGFRWWEAALPERVRSLFLGEGALLPSLVATRGLALWALTATLALGVVLLLAAPRVMRTALAVVLALSAFTFFGAYERLREGVRKPFLIRDYMFSNGLRIDQIEAYDRDGVAAHSGWVAAAGDEPATLGRALFRAECASCHTLDGYRGIRPLLPSTGDLVALAEDSPPGSAAGVFNRECRRCHADSSADEMMESLPSPDEMRDDPDFMQELVDGMIEAAVGELKEMGDAYASLEPGQRVDVAGLARPYMPPFVGSDDELEALASYLSKLSAADAIPADAPQGGE